MIPGVDYVTFQEFSSYRERISLKKTWWSQSGWLSPAHTLMGVDITVKYSERPWRTYHKLPVDVLPQVTHTTSYQWTVHWNMIVNHLRFALFRIKAYHEADGHNSVMQCYVESRNECFISDAIYLLYWWVAWWWMLYNSLYGYFEEKNSNVCIILHCSGASRSAWCGHCCDHEHAGPIYYTATAWLPRQSNRDCKAIYIETFLVVNAIVCIRVQAVQSLVYQK